MAMLTNCLFCSCELVVPSADIAYELTDSIIDCVEALRIRKQVHRLGFLDSFCCQHCFAREIAPHLDDALRATVIATNTLEETDDFFF